MKNKIEGVITALATPFLEGRVDTASFEELVKSQLASGVQGFVVNGTTGESPTLSKSEVEKLFYACKKHVQGKVPIILGTGSNSTEKTIEDTQFAKYLGADAALVVVPYYNKPPQRGLVRHFEAIADACPIPLILYNVPGRTISSLNSDSITYLSHHPRISGIKEASGDLKFFDEIKRRVDENFTLLSGDDATSVEFCRRGGHGVISVVSHLVPKILVDLINQARHGNISAEKDWLRFRDLVDSLYTESNPIPIKAAIYKMGLFSTAEMRLPLVTLQDDLSIQLDGVMTRFGLLGGKHD